MNKAILVTSVVAALVFGGPSAMAQHAGSGTPGVDTNQTSMPPANMGGADHGTVSTHAGSGTPGVDTNQTGTIMPPAGGNDAGTMSTHAGSGTPGVNK